MPCILIQFAAARSFDYAQDDGAGRAYARAFEEKNFAREYRPNSQRKRSLRLVGKRKISSVKGERLRIANPPKAQKFFVQWRISAALTNIVLSSTLTSIGDYAFNNCPWLASRRVAPVVQTSSIISALLSLILERILSSTLKLFFTFS